MGMGGDMVRELSPRTRRPSNMEEYRPFRRWFPWLVPTMTVANIAVFVAVMYFNDCPDNSPSCTLRSLLGRFAFESLDVNPLLGPSPSTLVNMGALEVTRVVKENQGWRLITCIWLHGGVAHLLLNMLSLLLVGIRLEQEFGFVRIGLVYIISGFGGSLLSALFSKTRISVGASGALLGLLGSMLSELITNWTIYENKLAALLTLIFVITINFAFGFLLPAVDNYAHIGGFMTGFLLGFMLLIRPHFGYISQKNAPLGHHTGAIKRKSKHKTYQIILLVIAAVLLIAWLSIGLVMLYKGVNGNDHCPWCHYLSCSPYSKWGCKAQFGNCMSTQKGTQLNLTCKGSGRIHMYLLANANSPYLVYELCNDLCNEGRELSVYAPENE